MDDGIEFKLAVPPSRTPGAPSGAVIVGESLRVVATVRNATSQAVSVMRRATTPVVYELTRVDVDLEPLTLRRSPAEGFAFRIVDSQLPPMQEVPAPIAPGASYDMSDDLVACHPGGIPAGRYRVVAHCPVGRYQFESNVVSVVVEPAVIGQLVELYCPHTSSHAQAFDHRDAQGRHWLLLRNTQAERAEAGSFHRLLEVPGQGALEGLAVATHVKPGLTGRWTAWLRNGSIGACQSEGGRLFNQAAPVAVALDRPLLVATGFERPPASAADPLFSFGDALFLVVGERDGAAHVQIHAATAAGFTAGPISPLCPGPRPGRVLARCSPAQARIDLIWAETDGAVTRIVSRACSTDGEPLSREPRVMFECSAPLLALECFALDQASRHAPPTRVHALFGPLAGERSAADALRYVRLPFDPQAPVEAFEIASPASSVEARFERHAIAPLGAGDHFVLALRGQEIWRASAVDAGWRLLSAMPAPVGQLRAVVSNRRYWAALAVAGGLGVICTPDPAYSKEAG